MRGTNSLGACERFTNLYIVNKQVEGLYIQCHLNSTTQEYSKIFKPEPIKTRPLLNIEIFLLKYFMYSVYLLDAQERREKNVPIHFFKKKISHDNTIAQYS